jgi:hypothetical protein
MPSSACPRTGSCSRGRSCRPRRSAPGRGMWSAAGSPSRTSSCFASARHGLSWREADAAASPTGEGKRAPGIPRGPAHVSRSAWLSAGDLHLRRRCLRRQRFHRPRRDGHPRRHRSSPTPTTRTAPARLAFHRPRPDRPRDHPGHMTVAPAGLPPAASRPNAAPGAPRVPGVPRAPGSPRRGNDRPSPAGGSRPPACSPAVRGHRERPAASRAAGRGGPRSWWTRSADAHPRASPRWIRRRWCWDGR